MTTSSFVQTNYTTQTPAFYKAGIDGNMSVLARVAAMFMVYGSSNVMQVCLMPGAIYTSSSATLTEVGTQTSSTISSTDITAGQTRIDRIGITKASGGMVYIAGTASSAPTAPTYTSSLLPVAQVLLSTGTTYIQNDAFTDERTLYIF